MLLLAGAMLTAGCRLELDVHVAMDEDGSGSVEVVVGIDPDGIERIGGDLDAVLEVDDLEAAGWTVEGPDEEPDGYTRMRFRKPFDDPEEAAAIFAEIAGERRAVPGLRRVARVLVRTHRVGLHGQDRLQRGARGLR